MLEVGLLSGVVAIGMAGTRRGRGGGGGKGKGRGGGQEGLTQRELARLRNKRAVLAKMQEQEQEQGKMRDEVGTLDLGVVEGVGDEEEKREVKKLRSEGGGFVEGTSMDEET